MRAQAGMEYLALALVALALLMVSLSGLGLIKGYSDSEVDLHSFRSSAQRLHDAASQVCALGDGNMRTVTLRSSFRVEAHEGGYSMERDDLGIAKALPCRMAPSSLHEGQVHVRNEGRTIRLYQD